MKKTALPGSIKTSKQKFSLKAPGAKSVLLAADFTDWQQRPLAMKPLANGVWRISVTLPPGAYHYRFMVDGEWRDDPDCQMCVPNPYGSNDMVRMVPRSTPKPTRAETIPIKRRSEPVQPWEHVQEVGDDASRSRIIAL